MLNMKQMKIVIEGVSEEQIQRGIERMTKGWRLFFEEPAGVDYEFFNSFWGESWDETPESLKSIIQKHGINKNTGKIRPLILVFKLNGIDRFAWCSWERVLYDFNTKVKHPIEPKFAANITGKIKELIKV